MTYAPTLAVAALLVLGAASSGAQERRNWFNDPFEQATRGMRGCPIAEGPLLTQAEQQREAHARIERGTSCWLAKKCDQPNAYRRDHEINAAAAGALRASGALKSTHLWVITQRRFVFVQGCVSERVQIKAIADAVMRVAEVDQVIEQVMIGTRGKPPYPSAAGGPVR